MFIERVQIHALVKHAYKTAVAKADDHLMDYLWQCVCQGKQVESARLIGAWYPLTRKLGHAMNQPGHDERIYTLIKTEMLTDTVRFVYNHATKKHHIVPQTASELMREEYDWQVSRNLRTHNVPG
jgi:hypothetical protein